MARGLRPPAAGQAAATPATPEPLSGPAPALPCGPGCPSRPRVPQITGWKWPAGWIWYLRGYRIHPGGPIHPDNPAPAAPGSTPRARPARPAPRDPRTARRGRALLARNGTLPGRASREQRSLNRRPERVGLTRGKGAMVPEGVAVGSEALGWLRGTRSAWPEAPVGPGPPRWWPGPAMGGRKAARRNEAAPLTLGLLALTITALPDYPHRCPYILRIVSANILADLS